jgi:trans-2-enoyl-CoA reductase
MKAIQLTAVVAKADKLILLPADIDLQQAAMIFINPPTAVLLLEEFVALHAGDWIVFNAANASVSHSIIAVGSGCIYHTTSLN